MNKSQNQNVFSTFSWALNSSVSPFGTFYRPKWQISFPCKRLQLVKSLYYPFIYLENEKGIPFGRGHPMWPITCIWSTWPPGFWQKDKKHFFFFKIEAYKAKAKQGRIFLPPLSNWIIIIVTLFFNLTKELKFFYDWKCKEMVFAKRLCQPKFLFSSLKQVQNIM